DRARGDRGAGADRRPDGRARGQPCGRQGRGEGPRQGGSRWKGQVVGPQARRGLGEGRRVSALHEALTIEVPGGSIGAWRTGSGQTALVLHGGPGLSDCTQELAEELADRFTVVRYQQRGLPPTTLRGPYAVEDHVRDTIAVLDAVSDGPAWLIGHSWGGHLA